MEFPLLNVTEGRGKGKAAKPKSLTASVGRMCAWQSSSVSSISIVFIAVINLIQNAQTSGDKWRTYSSAVPALDTSQFSRMETQMKARRPSTSSQPYSRETLQSRHRKPIADSNFPVIEAFLDAQQRATLGCVKTPLVHFVADIPAGLSW